MAFASLEPFGFQSDLYGHALTSSILLNINRRRGAKIVYPEDLMPKEKKSEAGDFVTSLKEYFRQALISGKNK